MIVSRKNKVYKDKCTILYLQPTIYILQHTINTHMTSLETWKYMSGQDTKEYLKNIFYFQIKILSLID